MLYEHEQESMRLAMIEEDKLTIWPLDKMKPGVWMRSDEDGLPGLGTYVLVKHTAGEFVRPSWSCWTAYNWAYRSIRNSFGMNVGQGNHKVHYKWQTRGPTELFGHDVLFWCHVVSPY